MARPVGIALALAAFLLAAATACTPGYYVRREAKWASGTTGFVAGGGTITSTRSVGPWGPVSGVSIGPGRVTVYDGYTPYGYAPYGPGYGTATTCTGAVACGASGSTTITTGGFGVAP